MQNTGSRQTVMKTRSGGSHGGSIHTVMNICSICGVTCTINTYCDVVPCSHCRININLLQDFLAYCIVSYKGYFLLYPVWYPEQRLKSYPGKIIAPGSARDTVRSVYNEENNNILFFLLMCI